MNHADALKKLMPIDLGPISDMDIEVEGALYDTAASTMLQLLPEFFPSTTDVLIGRWEAEYGLAPQAAATLNDRRRALLARYVDVGNLSKNYFIAIAAALGYEIEITEGGEINSMFRAGISRAGDRVYFPAVLWQWTVTTLNTPPAADIINLFNDLNPPHMRLEFNG